MVKKMTIYSDGGARGNPGPAGIGAVIYDSEGRVLKEISEYIGKATNNTAEYKAILRGLEEVKSLGGEEVDCYLDSELVVKQLKGEYKVKNPDLAPFFVRIHNLRQNFKKADFIHIRREKNKEADKLVNLAIDNGNK